jgi:hypothetical protein
MAARAAPGALRATRAAGDLGAYHLGAGFERVKPKLLHGGSKNGEYWYPQGRGHMHQARVVAQQQMALLQERRSVHQGQLAGAIQDRDTQPLAQRLGQQYILCTS